MSMLTRLALNNVELLNLKVQSYIDPIRGFVPKQTTLYLFVCWLDSRHEDPVPVHKLHKGVADGISGTAYPNSLHHTGVPQLTHAQVPVKQLWKETNLSWIESQFGEHY